MARRHKRPARDVTREQAILSKPIRTDGVGEDPIVKAVMDESFVTASNQEASQIALVLQQLVRGQASILDNQGKLSGELERMRKRMAEYDEAERRWNEDREKFIQEVLDKAESLRVTGAAKEKLEANSARTFQTEVGAARARAAADQVRFVEQLAAMPKVSLTSPGKMELQSVDGQPTPALVPEVVRIKGKTWVLPPGKEVQVPEIVARVYRERKLSEQETDERKAALAVGQGMGNKDTVVAEKLAGINARYNSPTDVFPIASR